MVVQQQCPTCKGSSVDHHLYRAAGGRLHLPPARDAREAVGRRQEVPQTTRLLLRCSSAQLDGVGLGLLRTFSGDEMLSLSILSPPPKKFGQGPHVPL